MRVMITGAGGDIGRAIAHHAGLAGKARLFLTDIDEDALKETCALLSAEGLDIQSAPGDLSDADVPQTLVDQARRALGGLDSLVSNAGILGRGFLKDLSLRDYEAQFVVNTRATFLLGKAAYPLLAESKGSLIAISSISSENAGRGKGTYPASKAALNMLVQQMAVEWGEDGIRCNCISPGPTLTRMNAHLYVDPAAKAQREAAIPMRRLATPEDVANLAYFLMSPQATYLSGLNIIVDGALNNNLMDVIGSGAR